MEYVLICAAILVGALWIGIDIRKAAETIAESIKDISL